MEKKKVEKITVLKHSMKTSLGTIVNDIEEFPNLIMLKAEELGLEISGPQIWNYSGVDGKPETEIKLDICVPVKEAKGNPGQFTFDVLPAITCISETHNGAWSELGNTYQRVFGEMSRKSLIPKGGNREIYLRCDLENPENNITEIQVEIYQ
jgi:effector-binding domain-containing protein